MGWGGGVRGGRRFPPLPGDIVQREREREREREEICISHDISRGISRGITDNFRTGGTIKGDIERPGFLP